MAGKGAAVSGLYGSREAVAEAIAGLREAGVRSTDVSVLLHHGNRAEAGLPDWLTGTGAMAVPGLGEFLAAGPIVAALPGAPDLSGALARSGIRVLHAKRYDSRIREGEILLSIHCAGSDRAKRVREILRRTGANGIAPAGTRTSATRPGKSS